MLFNTTEFLYFCLSVLFLYWLFFSKPFIQNIILFFASLFFYGFLQREQIIQFWNAVRLSDSNHLIATIIQQIKYNTVVKPVFVLHLLFIIFIGFYGAKLISRQTKETSRYWTAVFTVILGAALLVVLKYTNFFTETVYTLLGHQQSFSPMHIIVPVGISFYTFTTVGYLVDVYRQNAEPEKRFFTYAAYISFFPHLLSGPIASATQTLPQFSNKRTVDLAGIEDGISQFLWGLFKKMVIADNIMLTANYCFANYENTRGLNLLIGGILFGFQLYADFSGYSDMARGVGKFFGFDLIQNFRFPFFAKNIQDFWHRWHHSLTIWFNEYIFSPIVIQKRAWAQYAAVYGIIITFLVSGLWHGAGWTFIIWGLLHGLILSYEILTKKWRNKISRKNKSVSYGIAAKICIYCFLIFSWIFFKANTLQDAVGYLSSMFSADFFSAPKSFILEALKWCLPLIVIEYIFRKKAFVLDMDHRYRWLKYLFYAIIIAAIYYLHKQQSMQEYYYFKF